MSQTNQPILSRTNPKPYPVVETESGFEFTTANNSLYEIYLGEGGEYFSRVPLSSQSVYFGFSRKNKPPKGTDTRDRRIQDTIKWAIETLITEEPDLLIVFHYSSQGRSANSRNQLFRSWLNDKDSDYVYKDFEVQSDNGPMFLVGVIARGDNPSLSKVPEAIKSFKNNKE